MTRETEPEGEPVEIPPVTSKNLVAFIGAFMETDDGKDMYRGGVRVKKQKAAWDREAKEIAALPVNERRKLEGRLRCIHNDLNPQTAIIARQAGDASRHNQTAHVACFLNDDRKALARLREDGVRPDNDQRVPGTGKTRGQMLIAWETLEAEAAKGQEYLSRINAAGARLSELELKVSIDVNAELSALVKEIGPPPFGCCQPITAPGAVRK